MKYNKSKFNITTTGQRFEFSLLSFQKIFNNIKYFALAIKKLCSKKETEDCRIS